MSEFPVNHRSHRVIGEQWKDVPRNDAPSNLGTRPSCFPSGSYYCGAEAEFVAAWIRRRKAAGLGDQGHGSGIPRGLYDHLCQPVERALLRFLVEDFRAAETA